MDWNTNRNERAIIVMSPNPKKQIVSIPFGEIEDLRYVNSTQTISQMLESEGFGLLLQDGMDGGRVFVDDILILREYWETTVPVQGSLVSVGVVPTGGDGGGNKVARTVAMVAVMVVAWWAGPAAAAAMGLTTGTAAAGIVGGVITAGVGIAGMLAVNALLPMPTSFGGEGQISGGQYTSLLGINNAARQYQKIQRLFGTHKITPPYAIAPFTEIVGDKTIGYYVFAVGAGDYDTASLKIGNTLLSAFSEYTLQEGYMGAIDIFERGDITETNLAIALTNADGPFTQTTAVGTTEISVDLNCTGLYGINDGNGKVAARTIAFNIEYRPTSGGSWLEVGGAMPHYITRKKQEQFSINFSEAGLAADEYDVRITRVTADDPSPTGVSGYSYATSDFFWSKLRSIKNTSPWTLDNIYLIALKIRLDGQINAGVDTFNLIASSKLAAYNGSSWDAAAASRNPAWVYTTVLKEFSNRRAVLDAEINLTAMESWADWCAANNIYFDGIVEAKTTVYQMLHQIAAVGRATPGKTPTGLYTVVRDIDQTVRTQVITPLNSWNFSGRKAFQDIPHGLKCNFVNSAENFQPDQMIVYRDGYNSGNATLFEVVDFPYVTTSDHVWMLARFHMAQALLRPEIFNATMDFEHIANGTTRGSYVGLMYDTILAGLGSALVKEVTLNGSSECTGLSMNNTLVMEGGKTYAMSIRRSIDGRFISASIVLDVGNQTDIVFSPVIPAADVPAEGDLVTFGESGLIELDCLVQGIDPINDTDAVLSLVEDAPDVRTADSGEIPAHNSMISHPGKYNEIPYAPMIETIAILSQKNVLSGLNKDIQLVASINFSIDATSGVPATAYQVQYFDQEDSGGDWVNLSDLLFADIRVFHVPVENTLVYDFRIRSVSEFGEVSDWDEYSDYTVDYTDLVPSTIVGVDLIQTGTVWGGWDCAIKWSTPTDLWNIQKFKVKVYKTSPLTLLRTEYVSDSQITYTYSYGRNLEDNGGTPIGSITFRVSAVNGAEEGAYDEHVVTHAAPSTVTSLNGEARMGGVVFDWDINTDDSFSHFLYRLKIETDSWSSWLSTPANSVGRMLSSTEKTAHGGDALVYIEVKSVNVFSVESSASADNQECGSLSVDETDISEQGPMASALFPFAPVVIGMAITDNSNNGTPGSAAGWIHWSSFSLWYNNIEYSIPTGTTSNKYVSFKDLSTTLTEIDVLPQDNYSDWTPKEDFLLVYNDSGLHQKAWETLCNAIIGSALITEAAVQTAHIENLAVATAKINDLAITTGKIALLAVGNAQINDLNATKITAGIINADRIGATSIVVGKLASDATDQMFTSSTRDFADIGGATKPADNATNTQVFRQSSEPTGTLDDLWFDTDNSLLYRHNGSAWQDISTEGIQAIFPPDANLIGFWHCNEGSGSTANDGSQSEEPATLNNLTWTEGVAGKALNSTGASTFYSTILGTGEPLKSATDDGNNYSLSCWFSPNGLPPNNDGYIFGRNVSGTRKMGIYQDSTDGEIKARVYEDDHAVDYYLREVQSGFIPTVGYWYHFVMTVGDDYLRLYIDSIEIGSAAFSQYLDDMGTVDYALMGSTSGGYCANGKGDQFRIYDKELDPVEVIALYAMPGGHGGQAVVWDVITGTGKPADNAQVNTIDAGDGLNVLDSAANTKLTGIDAGADVTGDNVAASVTGQGTLATKSSVDLNTAEVTNKSLAVLDSSQNTKLTGIDAGADVTGDNVAASVTGQGGLATKSSVNLGSSEVTNKSLANVDSTANSKLNGIDAGAEVNTINSGDGLAALDSGQDSKLDGIATGADVTSANVAASVSGQGTLATKNTVALDTEVTNKSLANLDSTANTKLTGIATGADVTGDNTADDTDKVNGLAASRVSGWAHGSDTTKIDGGDIYTNTILAASINVSTLSALTADIGTVTAGIVRSSDSRFKIDLTNKWLKVTDASAVVRVHLGYIA